MEKNKHTILKNCKSWIITHRIEFIILVVILVIGAFLRLYKIDQYMTFLGDEGRDVLVVRRLLTEFHPPLIGPGTSIGNMYLGPFYYYMMAIPLLLSNFNPVGPAIFIGLLGVATIFFVWWVTREWFGNIAALISAFLYAISPVIIIYSRSSWNPNIMPFFSLLTVYGMWRVWLKKDLKWLVVVGISYAACLQSHYLGLLLLPVIGIVWFISLLKLKSRKKYFVYSFIGLFLFLTLMSPLVIFDARHGWHNFAAIKEFFTSRQTTVSFKPWNAITPMWPIFTNITSDLVAGKNTVVGTFVGAIIGLVFTFVYFFKREKFNERNLSIILILTLWIGSALFGLGVYKQHIYDHYYGFIFAAPFIVLGGIIGKALSSKYHILGVFGVIGIVVLVFVDLQNSPLRYPPNRQMERAQVVAKKVIDISNGEKFNFALIADSNYDSAYRYFLNLDNAKVVDIDSLDTKNTITDQLLVVCERVKPKCDPTHNPKAEVANFGWTKVVDEWDDVFGVTIYKLGHTR